MKNAKLAAKTFPFVLIQFVLGIITIGLSWLMFDVGLVATELASDFNAKIALLFFVWLLGTLFFYWLLVEFIGYRVHARQIAIITFGITTGNVPDGVLHHSKEMLKKRFLSTTILFGVAKTIKKVNREINTGISKVGRVAENAAGNTELAAGIGAVSGIIQMFMSAILSYADACCLGYIFAHSMESADKTALSGIAIYFKNWKNLMKNSSKIVATLIWTFIFFGALSFAAVYGVMFLIYKEAILNVANQPLYLAVGIVLALLLQSILRQMFVRPRILVFTMRSYFETVEATVVDEESLLKLSKTSSTFKKNYSTSHS